MSVEKLKIEEHLATRPMLNKTQHTQKKITQLENKIAIIKKQIQENFEKFALEKNLDIRNINIDNLKNKVIHLGNLSQLMSAKHAGWYAIEQHLQRTKIKAELLEVDPLNTVILCSLLMNESSVFTENDLKDYGKLSGHPTHLALIETTLTLRVQIIQLSRALSKWQKNLVFLQEPLQTRLKNAAQKHDVDIYQKLLAKGARPVDGNNEYIFLTDHKFHYYPGEDAWNAAGDGYDTYENCECAKCLELLTKAFLTGNRPAITKPAKAYALSQLQWDFDEFWDAKFSLKANVINLFELQINKTSWFQSPRDKTHLSIIHHVLEELSREEVDALEFLENLPPLFIGENESHIFNRILYFIWRLSLPFQKKA